MSGQGVERDRHEGDDRDAPPGAVLSGRPGLETVARRAAALHRAWTGREPEVMSAAPGRVNLIGEHVDYAGGVMLPCAIDRWCVAAVSVGQPGVLRVRSEAIGGGLDGMGALRKAPDVSVALPRMWNGNPEELCRGLPVWARYIAGVANIYGPNAKGEFVFDGLNVTIASSLPLGAGLASSAALAVACAGGFGHAWREGWLPSPMDIADIARLAERHYVGVPCGIMDQVASVFCEAGAALLIDSPDEASGDIAARSIPFPDTDRGGTLGIVVINSGVKHALPDGGFAALVEACGRAARSLGATQLGTISPKSVQARENRLADDERRMAHHVTGEVARTRLFAQLLSDWPPDAERAAERAAALGRLLAESHASLRDLCRVSCPEIETIVAAATGTPGVHGARLTGAGFGGSVVALVEGERAESVRAAIESRVAAAMGRPCDTMLVKPVAGWVAWAPQ